MQVILWNCFLQGCDVFQTRTPEEPEVSSASYVPATEPSIVFQNVRNAFTEKNVVNYGKAFSDSAYTFVASPQAQLLYGPIFQSWNKASEEQYFTTVCNRSSPRVEWLSVQEQARTSTTVQYEVTYKIVGLPQGDVAEGRSLFTLKVTPTQLWVIERWIDYELNASSKQSTWSTVKALNAQ
ncbi:MAG: hypothetical protein N3A63_04760 [Bacteroidetes bacterium]|nr:hypothetical protein [Bacteroidota bacterium]